MLPYLLPLPAPLLIRLRDVEHPVPSLPLFILPSYSGSSAVSRNGNSGGND